MMRFKAVPGLSVMTNEVRCPVPGEDTEAPLCRRGERRGESLELVSSGCFPVCFRLDLDGELNGLDIWLNIVAASKSEPGVMSGFSAVLDPTASS